MNLATGWIRCFYSADQADRKECIFQMLKVTKKKILDTLLLFFLIAFISAVAAAVAVGAEAGGTEDTAVDVSGTSGSVSDNTSSYMTENTTDSLNSSSSVAADDPDRVLEEASSGKYRPISPSQVPSIVNDKAYKLIKVLNTMVVPFSVLVFIIGCFFILFGFLTGNKGTRSWGVATIFSSLAVLALIRLAPVIVAIVDGIMRSP